MQALKVIPEGERGGVETFQNEVRKPCYRTVAAGAHI